MVVATSTNSSGGAQAPGAGLTAIGTWGEPPPQLLLSGGTHDRRKVHFCPFRKRGSRPRPHGAGAPPPSGDEYGRLARCRAGFGAPPFIAANNARLRSHFHALTRRFLQPFEQYFTTGSIAAAGNGVGSAGRQDQAACSSLPWAQSLEPLWAYADPESLLEPFDENRLMQLVGRWLRKDGGGFLGPFFPCARGGVKDWLAIYSAFLASPLFASWFDARRAAAVAQFEIKLRTARLDLTEAKLSAVLASSGHAVRDTLLQRVDLALQAEVASEAPDEVLMACMEQHKVFLQRQQTQAAGKDEEEASTTSESQVKT